MRQLLHRNEDIQQLIRETKDFQSHTISIPESEMGSSLGSVLVQCIANEFALNKSDVSNDKDFRQHSDNVRSRITAAMIDAISSDTTTTSDGGAANIRIPEHRRRTYERLMLRSFQYNTLYDREHNVKNAHRKTLRWVFSENDRERHAYDSLQDWLKSSEQVYWITGKPGSGKTTLMKFIASTLKSEMKSLDLSDQYCSQSYIMASFYFWALGPEIQASKEGLYRTLIYQLLSQRPDTIPLVSPERWERLCLFGEIPQRFEESELRHSLGSALSVLTSKEKVCVFVDGLDEFAGDCDDLVAYFKELVETYPIKLCVASRPWEVFRDALQDKPKLQMEDLTHNDIQGYVTCRLQDDPNFDKFQRSEPEFAQNIIEVILDKAQGVFLWVELVVSSLIVGLRSGDRISDLQRRLDRLPQNLEGLFDRIIRDLDSEYMEQAIQYLRVMEACQDAPSAVLFSFADEDPEISVSLQPNHFDRERIDERVENLRKRLNTRLKGLLEIGKRRTHARDSLGDLLARAKDHAEVLGRNFYNPSITTRTREYTQYLLRTNPYHAESVYEDGDSDHESDASLSDQECGFFGDNSQQSTDQDPVFHHASSHCVQYLHRTVKDYFNKPRLKEMLTDNRLQPFDPHLQLCSGYLAFFKSCHTARAADRDRTHAAANPDREKCKTIFRCVESASLAAECSESLIFQILDELERSITSVFTVDFPFRVESDWIRPLRLSKNEVSQPLTIWATNFEDYEDSFLALTVKAGVVGYVKRELLKHRYPQSAPGTPQSRLTIRSARLASLRHLWKVRHNQPSCSDVLLKETVVSIRPNSEMARFLLQQGANPNMIFRDAQNSQERGSEYTPWVALLALTIGVFSRESWDPHNKLEWIKVAHLMVDFGARFNKRTIHEAVKLLRLWRFKVSLVAPAATPHDRNDDIQLEGTLFTVLKPVVHHGDLSQSVGAGHWNVQYPIFFKGLAGKKGT